LNKQDATAGDLCTDGCIVLMSLTYGDLRL